MKSAVLVDVVGRRVPAGLGEDRAVRVDHSAEHLGAADVDADRRSARYVTPLARRLRRGLLAGLLRRRGRLCRVTRRPVLRARPQPSAAPPSSPPSVAAWSSGCVIGCRGGIASAGGSAATAWLRHGLLGDLLRHRPRSRGGRAGAVADRARRDRRPRRSSVVDARWAVASARASPTRRGAAPPRTRRPRGWAPPRAALPVAREAPAAGGDPGGQVAGAAGQPLGHLGARVAHRRDHPADRADAALRAPVAGAGAGPAGRAPCHGRPSTRPRSPPRRGARPRPGPGRRPRLLPRLE